MRPRDKKLYLVLCAIFLLVCAAAFFYDFYARSGKPAGALSLEILVGGEIVERHDLSRLAPGTLIELRREAGYNALSVAAEGVRMVSADCRGGDCLRMGPIAHGGEAIVCLPHKLIVRLRAPAGKDDLDAVVR